MILVSTGTHPIGFKRLIKRMDELASQGSAKILIQIGASDYTPQNCDWFRFTSSEQMNRLMDEAHIVVCHGAMTGLLALEKQIPLVVFPRQRKYEEHIDDHQVEFAKVFSRVAPNSVRVALEAEELHFELFRGLTKPNISQLMSKRKLLIEAIRQTINDI